MATLPHFSASNQGLACLFVVAPLWVMDEHAPSGAGPSNT
jgi:hypothetical protein